MSSIVGFISPSVCVFLHISFTFDLFVLCCLYTLTDFYINSSSAKQQRESLVDLVTLCLHLFSEQTLLPVVLNEFIYIYINRVEQWEELLLLYLPTERQSTIFLTSSCILSYSREQYGNVSTIMMKQFFWLYTLLCTQKISYSLNGSALATFNTDICKMFPRVTKYTCCIRRHARLHTQCQCNWIL